MLSLTVSSYRVKAVKIMPSTRGGVPFVNTLVLGNLCEYRHKSYIARTRFFGLHFCRRSYGSIFNHFDVMGLQSYRIR